MNVTSEKDILTFTGDVIHEAQKPNKEETAEASEKGEVVRRDMNYIEKTILQNQKALASTLADVQSNFAKSINQLVQNNNSITNRLAALEMQLQIIQVRLAALNNGGATAR